MAELSPDRFIGDRQAARAVRRARRSAVEAAGWGQVLQDWYVALFITATLLTMLFAATGGAILTPDCDTAMCLDRGGYRLVAIGFALAGLLAMVVGLRSVGPASADPGQATWLLSAPADRGVLRRGRVLLVALVAVVAGGAWGVLVGFAVVGGSGAGAGLVPVLCAGGGVVLTLLVLPLVLHHQGGSVRITPAARAVPDAELARAGQVAGAVTAATLMLDSAALEVLAARRRLGRRGRFISRPGAGGVLSGFLVHELRALVRRLDRVLVGGLACVAALVIGLLLGRFVGAALAALTVFAVTKVAAGGLATWISAPGLRRAVPAHPAAVTAVLTLPPFAIAILGATVALLALGLPWWGPVVLALGATAGVLRASDPPPGLGVAVSTPGGVVHMGLVLKLVIGTDLALLAAVGVLIADAMDAGPAALALGALLLGWQVLRDRD